MSDGKNGSKKAIGITLAAGALVLVLGGAFVVRQALTGGPGEAAATPAVSAAAIEEVLRSSRTFLRQGEYGKAGALLRPAVDNAPTDQDLRLAYAEALLGQRKAEAAHEQFEAAIVIGPDAPGIRFDAATVASAAGLTERAEEHYWEAQRLDPSDARYPLYLAQVQRKLNKANEAKKNLLLAAKLDPGLDVAWGVLADLALEENKLSVARGHVKRAREINPESAAWRIVEARIERRDNKPEVALAMLTGLSPAERARQPMALREMALALGLLERPEDAAELYADASAMASGEALGEILCEASKWFEQAGKIDEAIVYASRAARAGGEGAGELLDRLQARVRESAEDPDA